MRKVIEGGPQDDKLEGHGTDDKIYGNGGDDGIGGHGGNDLMDGGPGSDRIGGGDDHDKLIGGGGNDTFIFRSFAPDDSDIVKDFKHRVDSIELDASIFTALNAGHLRNAQFVVGTKALDDNDYVIYDKSTGELYYDDDGNGAHKKHLIATFLDEPDITASDIEIEWPH